MKIFISVVLLSNLAVAESGFEALDFKRPLLGVAGVTEQKRIPSKYYDWDLSSEIISKESLNPNLAVEDVRRMFGSYGSFQASGSDLLFTFKDGTHLKISEKAGKVSSLNLVYGNYRKESLANSNFLKVLNDRGNKAKILRTNSYYDEELKIEDILVGNKPSSVFPKDSLCSMFSIPSGTSFLPDEHGDISRFDFVSDMIANKKIDWFGIEMVPHNLQGDVNKFINQPESSTGYKQARDRLITHFSNNWNYKFNQKDQSGVDNPYFKLLEIARLRKVQVYAMDVDLDYYDLNPLIDPLVIGTRNLVWVNQLPKEGKGLVFGGRGHFEAPIKATVQTLYHQKYKDQPVTMIDAKSSCSLSDKQAQDCRSDISKLKSEGKCSSLDEFRCIRKNFSFVSSTCSSTFGIVTGPRGTDGGSAQPANGSR